MNNNNKENFYKWVATVRRQAALLFFCSGLVSGLHAQDGCHRNYEPVAPQHGSASFSERITWQGSGSKNDPYQVATLCQLQEMRSSLRAHYKLTNHIDATLTHNWNDGKGFTPIEPFFGSFDGQGYRIRNLFIDFSEDDRVGLFSSIEKGSSLQQIILVNSEVAGRSLVGSLVGHNREGIIVNSTAMGVVSGDKQAGGLVGKNEGIISNSHSHVVVRTEKASAFMLGGFVGQNVNTIKNSSSSGQVSGNASRVGGFAGDNLGGHILGCYATGKVVSLSRQIGGLVGRNRQGTITRSYATGSVTGNGDAGGLVGANFGHISYSYATGAVRGNPRPGPVAASFNSFMGGHTGNNFGLITHSYATGPVSGSHNLGGFVGVNNGQIANSYATGRVSGNERVGGFVGVNFSNSTVTGSYASGFIQGNRWVGGFAGYNLWSISYSYSAGKVAGTVLAHDFAGTNIGDISTGDIRESFPRTLKQLQCPTKPDSKCEEAATYSGWSAESWHFGSARTLPVLTGLTRIPASPKGLVSRWEFSTKLKLEWQSSESLVDFHELEISGLVRNVTATSFEIRDEHLAWIQTEYQNGSTVSYSVRTKVMGVVSHPATGHFRLPNLPRALEIQIWEGVTETHVTLAAPKNDSYNQGAANGTNANLEHFLQIFQEGNLTPIAEWKVALGTPSVLDNQLPQITIKFPGLQSNSRHRVAITTSNDEGKTMTEYSFTTQPAADSPPLILSDGEAILRMVSGDRSSKTLTLRARADRRDFLEWWVPPNSGPQRGRICFLSGVDENACTSTGTGTLTTMVYQPKEEIRENDQFFVWVTGNYGTAKITVLVTPSEPPTISGGRERYLDIPTQDSRASLELLAGVQVPEDLDVLEWSAQRIAGTPEESTLNFLVNNQITTRATGASVQVQFTRPEGSKSTGGFTVSTRDPLGATAETRVIVRQVDAPPVISEISGNGVLETDKVTVHVAPESRAVTLRAVAQGGSPQSWVWTIVNPYSDYTVAHFMNGSSEESSDTVSGTSEVLVRYSRLSGEEIDGTGFLIKVAGEEGRGKTDQVFVRLQNSDAAPLFAHSTPLNKTISSHSQDLVVSLNTLLPRVGLTWSLIGGPTSGTSAKFLENHGAGQARLKLLVPRDLDEAMFMVRVAAGERSNDIMLTVERQKVVRLRLKVFLSGVVR